jgi:hypothetical protein
MVLCAVYLLTILRILVQVRISSGSSYTPIPHPDFHGVAINYIFQLRVAIVGTPFAG